MKQKDEVPDTRLLAKLERQLDDLREIQASLLPWKIPEIPGYDVFPFYRSAAEVGYNWYDLVERDENRLVAAVGEPSVPGIPGAMISAMTCTLVKALVPLCHSLAEALRRMNAQLGWQFKRGTSAVLLLAELDVKSRVLTVCSAGGAPGIVFRERTRELEEVGGKGIALGIEEEGFEDELIEDRIELRPRDRVVLFTSGAVRIKNAEGEEYGLDRLRRCVKKHARKRSRDFVLALVRELDDYRGDRPQEHDVLVSTLRVLPE